ncbi:hypothetical protein [Photobacterium ganghwense]|uniref:hypothetical protein n=1 Tax=Photobacterium ganghwense TaxID=320778 RepID=UPI0039EEAB11
MKHFTTLKKHAVKVGLVAVTMASGPALAEGANSAAITAAISSGKSMLETTTGGLIALGAIVFGVGMVVGLLKRG